MNYSVFQRDGPKLMKRLRASDAPFQAICPDLYLFYN